ncbi:tRNA (34-2'-O)-methyltransferase regulator WDR6 [Diretmus argenteus]
METTALIAPVTALEFLTDKYLLTGEGPVLTVYRLQPRPKAGASLSLLNHYRVHGIRPRPPAAGPRRSSATETRGEKDDERSSASELHHYDLVVFGGKAVRLVRLSEELHGGDHLHLEALGPLVELQDWALDVRWLSGEGRPLLGVALAHNSALLLDVHEGKALVQSSCLEGCLLYSALLLVDQTWGDSVLVGGTVFNQLVVWKPGGGGGGGGGGGEGNTSEQKAPVERRLLGHSGVIFSISYLREKGCLASASDDRSVRLWSVGVLGGPGGKCGDLNPSCFSALYGHQARVFSVHLSPGKVFSAGEDGACLVWDWAGGGKVARTLKGHRAGGVRALAVSEGKGEDGRQERWVATGGADGGVRLWRVEESEEGEGENGEAATETLTDLGFAGEGVPKVLCVLGGASRWTRGTVVVCTDQGIVYQYCNRQWELVWRGGPEFTSYCVMEMLTVGVKDSLSEAHLCAVGNLSGGIQVFPLAQPRSGILLSGGPGKIHSIIWVKGRESERPGAYLLASGAEGLVHRWCVAVTTNQDSCLVLHMTPLPPFVLPPCAKRWLTAAVRLHPGPQEAMWVCGDRRGSLLLFQEGIKRGREEAEEERDEDVLIGSTEMGREGEDGGNGAFEERERNGVEQEEHRLQPLSCLFGVHGKQGVTSVCEHQELLYSAGRDGCVRIFRPRPRTLETPGGTRGTSTGADEGLQLEVLRVQRACRGMEWLERVLILEPEQHDEEEEGEEGEGEGEVVESPRRRGEEKRENEGREARFVIAGFHGVHFVVWDPVRQARLLAVACGGGHRSWSLWPPNETFWSGHGALVYIKQGLVLASKPPGETPAWAGRAGQSAGWSLRDGVHGRGVGCVCRLGGIRGPGKAVQAKAAGKERIEEDTKEEHWEILATGGEDTSLTVMAVQPDSGVIKVLSVLTDHISSVRALAAAMRRGGGGGDGGGRTEEQSLSVLLVSAGGRAQMQCYRLLIGWDGQRRVPSCQVIQVAGHRLDEQWERRRNRHKTVKMDPETRYMCISVVEEEAGGVLLALACSDGAVRLFSVSEVKGHIELLWESFYHQRCVLSVATYRLEDETGSRYQLLFSAATDGEIAVWDVTAAAGRLSDAPTPPIPRLRIPAHQSGVNSLAVWAEKTGRREEGGCLVTVASGGDDGQLTVSVVQVQYPDGATEGSRELSQPQEQLMSEQQTEPHGCPQFPLTSQSQPRSHSQSQSQPLPLPQPHSLIHLQLRSQSRVPLAHAAPLTALGLLTPGLLVSTSPDQRLCLWRVCSTGISHSGALYSHVADAAGLAAWEEGMIGQGKAPQRPHQVGRRKRGQQQPGRSAALLSDTTMTPWGGLSLSESSFTAIPPPPPPPAPQPTPSTPYRGRRNAGREVGGSFPSSQTPHPPDTVHQEAAGRGLRVRRRVLSQRRVPRPPRLPPMRPVTNLSFSRSFTFSFFELPLHQSPRCRAERVKNLMLLLRRIHY